MTGHHANAHEIASIPPRISDATIAQAYGIPEVTVRAIRNKNKIKPVGRKARPVIGYTGPEPYDDRIILNSHYRKMKEGSDALTIAALRLKAEIWQAKAEHLQEQLDVAQPELEYAAKRRAAVAKYQRKGRG